MARKLLDHLAIAFISIGLIAIVIEFRDWQEYFQQRIAETILQQSYFRTLDRDQLIALQTNMLKAFFKVEDLDRKDSFLDFFHSRLQTYIASPYREDVDYQFAIMEAPGEVDYFQVDEIVSFKCRAVGELIPEYVLWTTEIEPTALCEEVTFTMILPRNVTEASDLQKKYPGMDQPHLVSKSTDNPCKLVPVFDPNGDYAGYKLPLDEYRHMDGLGLKIHGKYKIIKGTPLAWRMSHPTRHLSVTVSYPAECRAVVNWFGFDDESVNEEERNPGVYNLRYDSWLLPDSGVSIHLVGMNPKITLAPALQQKSQST